MIPWEKGALVVIAVGVMLIANLTGEVSASSGIGLSPPERRVRFSGDGNATAMFLLFNPADTEQQFAVLLPEDSGLSVEPAEGIISAGGMQQLIFTTWANENATFEPRIVMRPAGELDQMLKTGITAKIIVEESAEPVADAKGGGLLSGMAFAVGAGKKTAHRALFAAGILPLLGGVRWLRKRWSKKDGKRNENGDKG